MIRTCLEFLLSRSLDSGSLPDAWLQRRVERDAQLKQFNSKIRHLDSLLRDSAAERRECMAAELMTAERLAVDGRAADASATNDSTALLTLSPTRKDSIATARVKRSGMSAAWLASVAAAAVLYLALAANWFRPSTPAVHAGEFSQQLTFVPGEVLWLITRAAETSRTHVPQLSPLAHLTLPTLPAWQDVAIRAGSPLVREPRRPNPRLLDSLFLDPLFLDPLLLDPLLLDIDSWHENWLHLKSRLSRPQSL